MQRRLIVMRHAKSSWDSEASSDHERPLNDRGRSEAPRVAAMLSEREWQPEYVLSSDARRTRETFALMQEVWSDEVPVEFLRALYLAGYHGLIAASGLVPQEASTIMLLGHNPGLEEVVYLLSNQSIALKTAMAVLLENESDTWPDALMSLRTWRPVDVIRGRLPKEEHGE
jgi:phosphohistidine phosphatase